MPKPNKKCQKCGEMVVPDKSIEGGPLFDIYRITCPKCGEEFDSGVEAMNEEIEPFNPKDLPRPLDR